MKITVEKPAGKTTNKVRVGIHTGLTYFQLGGHWFNSGSYWKRPVTAEDDGGLDFDIHQPAPVGTRIILEYNE